MTKQLLSRFFNQMVSYNLGSSKEATKMNYQKPSSEGLEPPKKPLRKTHKRKITLPDNFKLEEHLKEFPPLNYGFPADKKFQNDVIYAFLDLLVAIPARNKNLIFADGFVPMHMATMRNKIHKTVNFHVDYLVRTGVIELYNNGQYKVGEKSRGYKWTEKYENTPFVNTEVVCRYNEKTVKEGKETTNLEYPYLAYWYEQKKLSINSTLACRYAYELKEDKMQDKTKGNWDKGDKGKKYPVTQYQAVIKNICKIESAKYNAHTDDNVHRLHSVLTNIQKDFRNFITYDGQPLVSIDIKNCQPYLSCLILQTEFWQEISKLPININTLQPNIQELYKSTNLPIMIGDYLKSIDPKTFEKYINLVANGQIYEEIAKVANLEIEEQQSPITRKEAKELMFHLLFSPNGGKSGSSSIEKMKKKFETELFPEVANLLKLIKTKFPEDKQEKPHARLSVLLQSIESQIVLHRCCKRIFEEYNKQIPVFTIHDSIVTTVGNEKIVESILMEEFTKYIGIPPAVQKEYWDLDEVNQTLLKKCIAEARL